MTTKVSEELALLEQRFAGAEAQWSALSAKLGALDVSGVRIGEETVEAIEAIQPRGAVVGAVGSFGMRA